MAAAYKNVLRRLALLSRDAPTAKPPIGYNQHFLCTRLFEPHEDPVKSNPFLMVIKKRSERYDQKTGSSQPADSANSSQDTPSSDVISDVPLPTVLRRHIKSPTPSLYTSNPASKITGFRIQVKGRKGSRTSKQAVNYGRIETAATGRSYVDFGKASYTHKKGVTGVKVWIGYA